MSATITRNRTRPLLGWWLDAVLLAAFVALTVALINGHLLTLDQRVADWALSHQPKPVYWTARVFNYLGQGGQVLTPVSLVLTAVLFWRSRSIRAAFPFAAAFVLTYLTIGPLKIWSGRAAPRFQGPDPVIMHNPNAEGVYAMSYPSGHLGNSLVWYAVIAILTAALLHRSLRRWETWMIRVVPVAIVFVTTVYTGFHWLTDSIAGLLLGVVVARLIERIPFDRIPLPGLRGWERPAGFTPPSDRPASRA
ncbi:phosphatase PAP2 family protein [Actinoplanes solisilvae]|uniref:phosphatase PAP2 family protein n=1 Tax=Actinoplanes solisilvae TaxID=2486853 RepID=UPI000FDADF77|nr:phosphatase PAP2 family protein [Actinoplanes solisilvae]